MENIKNTKISFPRWDELPEIDLYMDQVIGFFEKKLAFLTEGEEKSVTSTMINNYVKHKVIAPPVKKKYSREHLAYLFMIITLKKVFTMSEIKTFILKLTAKKTPNCVYDDFCDTFENACKTVFENGTYQCDEACEPILNAALAAVAFKLYSQSLMEEK